MPEKIATLARLLIFPNTTFPGCKAYIISAIDIDLECYVADTNMKSIYETYSSKTIKAVDKVQCIQDLLNILHLAYGHKFRLIRPFEDDEMEQYPEQVSNQ